MSMRGDIEYADYLTCPYCGYEHDETETDQHICEGLQYDWECNRCGKFFNYEAAIAKHYTSRVAPCKNGDADHRWVDGSFMLGDVLLCERLERCEVCGETR